MDRQSFLSYKKRVEQSIVDLMMQAYEGKQLTEEDMSKIAEFVLATFEKIKTHDELIGFLSHLGLKWSIFSPLAQIEEGKLKAVYEKKVAQNVLKLINNNQIDQAIALAQGVTKSI